MIWENEVFKEDRYIKVKINEKEKYKFKECKWFVYLESAVGKKPTKTKELKQR